MFSLLQVLRFTVTNSKGSSFRHPLKFCQKNISMLHIIRREIDPWSCTTSWSWFQLMPKIRMKTWLSIYLTPLILLMCTSFFLLFVLFHPSVYLAFSVLCYLSLYVIFFLIFCYIFHFWQVLKLYLERSLFCSHWIKT